MTSLSCVDNAEVPVPQEPALEDTEFLGRIDAVNRGWNIGDTVLVYDGVSQEAAEYVASRLNTDGDCILKGKVFNTSERYFHTKQLLHRLSIQVKTIIATHYMDISII